MIQLPVQVESLNCLSLFSLEAITTQRIIREAKVNSSIFDIFPKQLGMNFMSKLTDYVEARPTLVNAGAKDKVDQLEKDMRMSKT